MLLNKFLFPAPKPPHYTSVSHRRNLFWLPADSSTDSPIPCMFYSPENSNRKIEHFIIFCHGNGCDIGSMQYTLSEFSRHLNVYIISFEYPSYGLCLAQSPNQQTINNHADRTFNFVHKILNWPIERIIIYGHSIGSGTACYLASNQLIGALILQSPYTAINNLVREKVGFLSLLVNSRSWDNLEAMKNIKCPVLFIHGLDDTVIPSNHSQILYDACLNFERKKLVLLRNEDHNSMTETTLLKYITPFIEKQCKLMDTNIYLPIVKIDKELREQPQNISSNNINNSSSSGVFSSLYSMSRASTSATMSTIRTITGKQKNESNENE
jgi:alpha-beta hydrolase superfamily lysophospholipase